ncbi:imm11 family protein [Amaricoccus macauensis]|uniref:imm11 family protein n=1 Tax=Amaricoccus macauensis TaxID=57001 RepID=UPI003C7DC4E5
MAFRLDLDFFYPERFAFEYLDKNGIAEVAIFGLSRGDPIDPATVPRIAQAQRGKRMPDVCPMPGLNAVSSRFRDLVEELEPGVHQFFEIEFREQDGIPIPGQYYTFNCPRRIDTILVNESGLGWKEARNGMPTPNTPRRQFCISSNASGGAHIWCENFKRVAGIMVSDQFAAEVKKRELTGLEVKATCNELDVPYVAEQQVGPMLAWLRANPDKRKSFQLGDAP